MATTTTTIADLTPQQQDWLIRAAQGELSRAGYFMGRSGPHHDGRDGDLGRLTIAGLNAYGEREFPARLIGASPSPSSPPPQPRPQDMSYQELWDSMEITGDDAAIAAMVRRIRAGHDRYAALSVTTGVPWYVIGILHALECNCDFTRHLHNGDPLTARTKQVPKGRPAGNPPFSWEESALDALKYDGFTGQKDWSVPATLRRFEVYNGLGYRTRGYMSPYLWSMTNHYTRGKFVRDGKYDADAVSAQVGAAVLLSILMTD